jgi:hypothetical protein
MFMKDIVLRKTKFCAMGFYSQDWVDRQASGRTTETKHGSIAEWRAQDRRGWSGRSRGRL